ncbi:STAS domain-containing protein [Vogesella sp. DC21W]|uniref:STAS domain-containing protein n=1 Tax=Vogesella aquatica TaxID=2984206 RepID=A0ABT5IZT8_9NEIS|nr:STAS domain-containing protein [Vogesella aquatica]MDC7718095.1 STAS domain-containing protein [Vogesella aquatica]
MSSTIKLDEECTIYQAAQLRQQLADALMASDSLTVDLSAVGEMDSSAAQVLLWLHSEATRLQKTLALVQLSAAARELFTMLGLLIYLPIVEEEAGHES